MPSGGAVTPPWLFHLTTPVRQAARWRANGVYAEARSLIHGRVRLVPDPQRHRRRIRGCFGCKFIGTNAIPSRALLCYFIAVLKVAPTLFQMLGTIVQGLKEIPFFSRAGWIKTRDNAGLKDQIESN